MSITIGSRVRCIKGGTGFPGLLGTVKDGGPAVFHVDWDNPPSRKVNITAPSGGKWSLDSLEEVVEEWDKTSTRPLIDFSLSRYATAREYAAEANSRVLKDSSQVVLDDVASGLKVDAYALNEAVLDAMRSATTRKGQSMARRDLATKIAHLGHIVQAVLESHADGLPAYAEGDRSRKIETLEGEIAALTNSGAMAVRELNAQTEEVARLRSEISFKNEAFEEVEAARAAFERIADEYQELLTVAKSRLDAEGLAYVEGYQAGRNFA